MRTSHQSLLTVVGLTTALFITGCATDTETRTVATPSSIYVLDNVTPAEDVASYTVNKTILDDNVTLHVFTALPASQNANSTYIFETDTKLVLIDSQFRQSKALAFKNYALSLGKSIDRLVLTHGHIDHYFGLENFSDGDIYALQETIDAVTGGGINSFLNKFAPTEAPTIVTIPNKILIDGEFTIDNVVFNIKTVKNSEHADQVIIELPEQNVIALGDLFYNNIHAFVVNAQVNKGFDTWTDTLSDYNDKGMLLLPGHGVPSSDASDFLRYLQKSKELLASSPAPTKAEYLTGLQDQFPQFEGGLAGLSANILQLEVPEDQ